MLGRWPCCFFLRPTGSYMLYGFFGRSMGFARGMFRMVSNALSLTYGDRTNNNNAEQDKDTAWCGNKEA